MIWYAWVIVVAIVVSTLAVILAVDRPRDPLTPLSAVAITITNGLFIWGIVSLATGGCS